eukprot:CAMPEP_0201490058 /NCGR_PEP_ID=MMETSP0151_2-20130828/24883_1 /ASSEMBLY_ACC=CAM_ASM_000257 /TAXON_ID=200890 /ORGANISM="Paramoeba atlantica, Strain 621/1 / CCAP 1560/9" /LENGTH=167 /DNA_ID=CAMNT_0047875859 /DNA_START=41 /DNA_END=544 /DNA_ORIENTATION=-
MGCCFSDDTGTDERAGLLSSDPVPASQSRAVPQSAQGPLDNLGGRATPIQEEKRLAELASNAQRNFIAVPPSSFQEPSRLDQEFLQDREEFYRSHLSALPGNGGNPDSLLKLPEAVVIEREIVDILRGKRDHQRENDLLLRTSEDVNSALIAMSVADVGPLITSFDA